MVVTYRDSGHHDHENDDDDDVNGDCDGDDDDDVITAMKMLSNYVGQL